MSNIFIMALEPIETRYTAQWFNGLPKLLNEEISKRNLKVDICNVFGNVSSNTQTSKGAFLNFTETNVWKNTQTNKMAVKFANNTVLPGDKILFTDAWHPGILQIKYMSELLDVPVEIHSIWHAGSYDPQDFLGRKIKNKKWSYNAEQSFYHASNYNYFATQFHIDLFKSNLLISLNNDAKCVQSGQPHNELIEILSSFKCLDKKRQVVFPHRVAAEKQTEIFKDLAACMPNVDFIICQEKNLSKLEYHTILAESMISFSANLQETLGISSCIEAPLVDTLPLVPRRLSYTEIFQAYDDFLYNSEWSESWNDYSFHKPKLIEKITHMLDHYQDYVSLIRKYCQNTLPKYATADVMISGLLS